MIGAGGNLNTDYLFFVEANGLKINRRVVQIVPTEIQELMKSGESEKLKEANNER